MSSGMISLDTWCQQLMPMLSERARARLPGRPQNANQGYTPSDASSGRSDWCGTAVEGRIEDGLIEEHWESVDWVRTYQSFGLLSGEVKDA
jgi:hypothetical protein